MNNYWQSLEGATCLTSHCFCEGSHLGSWAIQPMNTYSTAAFLISAMAVYWTLKKENKKDGVWNSFYSILYLSSLVILWFGTLFFHASLTKLGQWSDGMGLYFVISFVGLYFLNLKFTWGKLTFLFIFLMLNIVAGAFSFSYMEFRLPLFGALVALTFFIIIFMDSKKMVNYKRLDFVMALGFFGIGLLFQVADNKLLFCLPYSLWQGHALWHLLAGVATYYLFLLMNGAGPRRVA